MMCHTMVLPVTTPILVRGLYARRPRRVFLAIATACSIFVACSQGSGSEGRGTSATTTSQLPSARVTADAGTSPPTGATHALPRSVPADCSSDVTRRLSRWMASVPDNSTMTLGKDACYRIDGSLRIAQRWSLLIDGNGATFKAMTRGTRTRIHIGIEDSENIIVRNLTVEGANPLGGATSQAYDPELEAQHGFNLGGVRRVLLDGVQAHDVHGDFVYVSSSGRGERRDQPSQDVAVVRSRFRRSGRQGIAITNGRNVTIAGNLITDVARSMFDLEPNKPTNQVRDIAIDRNTTGAAVNFWIASKGAGNQIGDVVVRGNTMRFATGGLVFVFGGPGGARGPFTFEGNRLQLTGAVTDEGAQGAFFFAHTDSIGIRNNQLDLPQNSKMPAVELRSCSHVRVDGNRVKNSNRLVMADRTSTDVQASR
jgi:hypothetical protein